MTPAPRETVDHLVTPGSAVDGVLVVGMEASGVRLVGNALSLLGLAVIDSPAKDGAPSALRSLNEEMLRVAAGGEGRLPVAAPAEVARALAPWEDEAARTLADWVSRPGRDLTTGPWVWADPGLSFLGSFWANTLAVRPAVVLVHRDPAEVVAVLAADEIGEAEVAKAWDRHNRGALLLSSKFPTLVVNYADAVSDPKLTLSTISEFLHGLGVVLDNELASAVELMESASVGSEPPPPLGALDRDLVTLDRVLDQLSWTHEREHDVHGDDRSLVAATSEFYDEDYYGVTYDKGGVPYSREEKVWVDFMSRVSRAIVDTLQPATVLDVGCAIGLLVEALRTRGVDARGIDVSPWAIQQVPVHLQPYCRLGSVTDEIEGHYDLITCIETLEHVPPSLAEQSIANLCRHADRVLFSSTPDDYEEPTHLNVEPGRYWAKLFLRHGFVRDSGFDATFLAPHAMLLRRQESDAETLFESYEDALWDVSNRLQAARRKLEAELASFEERVQNIELRRAAENLASFEALRRLEVEQRRLAGLLTVREWELEAVRNTKTFRYTARLRWLYAKLRRRPPAPIGTVVPPDLPDGTYEHWIELFDVIDEPSRRHIESRVRALDPRPKISVLMPVYNPPLDMLRAAIESVRSQIYPDWELCIADDCSTDPEVSEVLADLAAADPRIKVLRRDENGHIAAASNSALSLVTGQWVALLDHDDVLAEHALALFALAIAEHHDAGIIYSDEDKLDEDGVRRDPYFKPDFDPLLLLGQNFLSHFSAFRKDLVDRVGGYRVGYEGSQDWDLTLRVSELLERRQVVHIPHVLYHWRVHASSTASLVSAKPYALEAGQRAVLDHLERTGRQTARLERIGLWGFNRVTWPLPQPAPKVTIVVPTRDGRLLNRCIDSVLNLTTYPNFDLVVIDNSSRNQSTLSYLQANEHRLSVIRYEHPFNHSAMNNFAVARTSSEVVCLLNDDTEVINGDWLSEMISHLSQPGVGAVGAKLLYGDGRIQHGGVILGVHGVAGHAHRNFDRLSPGYYGRLQLAQRMSAVSAACIVLRREAWDEVGGLDEQSLPNVLNDVDLCLRLRDMEWDIVWTPNAELFHHESTSRGIDSEGPQAEEFGRAAMYMKSRWGVDGLRRDPHYSPNLSLDAEDFSLAWPPRAPYTEV